MGFQVRSEGGKVLVDLKGRLRDLILSPSDAEGFARALDWHGLVAGNQGSALFTGAWEVRVEPMDALVAVRFTPFMQRDVGSACVVELPPATARKLANVLRVKVEAAKGKMKTFLLNRPPEALTN